MAGTQLLNDVSDSLTNKLNGDMWEEILPMLHIIALTTPKSKTNTVEDQTLKERLVSHVMNTANRRQNEAGMMDCKRKAWASFDCRRGSDDEEVDDEVEGNDENAISVA